MSSSHERLQIEGAKGGSADAPRQVRDGLYVIRGPAMPCMAGCRPGDKGDGLIHESGDVAVRVTPDGFIVVDDKFAGGGLTFFTWAKTSASRLLQSAPWHHAWQP